MVSRSWDRNAADTRYREIVAGNMGEKARKTNWSKYIATPHSEKYIISEQSSACAKGAHRSVLAMKGLEGR